MSNVDVTKCEDDDFFRYRIYYAFYMPNLLNEKGKDARFKAYDSALKLVLFLSPPSFYWYVLD